MTVQSLTLICNRCGEHQLIDQFRRYRTGSETRHGDCNTCRRQSERLRRLLKKHKVAGKFLTGITRQKRIEPLIAFVKANIRQFGGVRGFVEGFVEWEKSAPPGSSLVGKFHCAVLNSIMLLDDYNREAEREEERKREERYNLMSEAELEAELDASIRNSITKGAYNAEIRKLIREGLLDVSNLL